MARKAAVKAVVEDDVEDTATAKTAVDEAGDDEVFDALTDEERAAMDEDDTEDVAEADEDAGDEPEGDDEAAEAKAEAEGEADEAEEEAEAGADEDAGDDAGEDAGEEAGEDDGDEAGGDAGDEADEEDEASADDAGEADDELADLTGPAVPDWQPPENLEDAVNALTTEARQLAERFDAGEVTASEYHQQLSAISDRKAELFRQKDRADMAQDMRQNYFVGVAVKRFLKLHPEYKPENKVMNRMLDGEVIRLQQEALAEGKDIYDPIILVTAHRNLQEAMGKRASIKKPAEAAKKVKLPPKKDKPKTPPTLAKVPSTDIDDTSGGKFARLDRLARTNPTAYEEALEKMSEAERDEYLRYG